MVFGQVGEAIAVAAIPAMVGRNIDIEAALVEVPVLDLILRPQHATNSHVEVLRFHLPRRYIHTYL